MKRLVLAAGLVLAVLHQDFWYWDRADLVFGMVPVGLAYHAAYTVVVAAFWGFAVTFAWPHEIERFSEGGGEREAKGEPQK